MTATTAAEPEAEQQRDKEEDIHHSLAPDQEIESGLDSEKRSRPQTGRTQAHRTIHTRSSAKRKRGRSGPVVCVTEGTVACGMKGQHDGQTSSSVKPSSFLIHSATN
ncbi:hypothetical protein E2562_034808 [Oryza meyeriana var. granulata]|uniref:Uncharacterized protein n=1 Tax=Oryza meyeriana var. granulata TaxID=110450 RepID=A0A6G1E5G7_9ORYZ|nr:hypothetical protein E2562_034808 [Oryza meyeriana var. granulata]